MLRLDRRRAPRDRRRELLDPVHAAPAAQYLECGEARFRANEGAWAWFQKQAPFYRRQALHWVVSAKRAETRERRLTALIADSASGEKVKPLRR